MESTHDHYHNRNHGHTVDSACEHNHTLQQILKDNILDTDIIIDIGCGSGATSKKLSETIPHKQFYGFDASPERIDYALKNNASPTLDFFVADISLPWDSLNSTLKGLEGQVSLAWSNHVLNCLAEKKMAVFNLAKLLKKPGGRAYVNVIFMRDVTKYLAEEDQTFVSQYVKIGDKEEQLKFWKDAFQEAGFSSVEMKFVPSGQRQQSSEKWKHIVAGSAGFWRTSFLSQLEEKLQDEIMEKIGTELWGRLVLTKHGEEIVASVGDNPMDIFYEEIGIVGIM